MNNHRETAYNWHGGMWSPLYAFASSGIVEDLDALLAEIDQCINWCANNAHINEAKGVEELYRLHEYIARKLIIHNGRLVAPWGMT